MGVTDTNVVDDVMAPRRGKVQDNYGFIHTLQKTFCKYFVRKIGMTAEKRTETRMRC